MLWSECLGIPRNGVGSMNISRTLRGGVPSDAGDLNV
jgi:hypothetical protein